MKYFFLSIVAFTLSFASLAVGPIKGGASVCQGSTAKLTIDTFGGTWSSGSTLVATIGSSTGIVTGVYPGTSIIVYKVGSFKKTAMLTVNGVEPIIGTMTVCEGLTTILSDAIYGGTWSSKDITRATVAPGISNVTVNAIKAGVDTIIYTFPSGCVTKAAVTIDSLPSPITGNLSVCVGETAKLIDATPNGVWSSSIPGVATIDISYGVASGIYAGTTIISYTGPNNCVRPAVFTVNPLPAPITGVAHTYQGMSTTLADATPGGTWSVNFPAIATIVPTSGLVKGVSSGVATVFYKLTSTTGCQISTHYIVNGFPDSAGTFPILGWFPFCHNYNDHSTTSNGNLVRGPGSNDPVDTLDRFGKSSNAYYFRGFNGVTSDILYHNPYYPTSTPTGTFTYSCWAKFAPGVSQSAIIMHNGTPNSDGLGFVIGDGAGTLFNTQVSVLLGGVGLRLGIDPYDGSTPLGASIVARNMNGWFHLYLERQLDVSSDKLNFYINNIFIGSATDPFNVPKGTFVVGGDVFNTSTSGYKGYVDDISIFNSILTDSVQRTETQIFNPDAASFTLGHDTTICNDLITLAPNPQITGRIYSWSTGDSLNNVITILPAPGRDTFSLKISQPYGCDAIDTIIVIKNPLQVFAGVDTNICMGDTITLHARPFVGFPTKFLWSTGDTTSTTRVALTGTYLVTVDSNGCRGHDTVYVTARVTPLVDLGPDIFNCQGQPDTIKNLYADYDKTFDYLWSTGSNAQSIVTNTSGSFWLQVTNKGCVRSDSVKALIVVDTFSFYSKDVSICLGQYVTGSASYNPIVSYQWTPTTGVPLSTIATTKITPDTSATYILTGSYPGCPDIVNSFHIDVQPYPTVFMGGNRNVCQFDTINITAQVTPNWYTGYRFSWSPGKEIDDSTRQTVILRADDTTHITQLKVKVSTSAGCVGTDSALIVVHPGSFDSSMTDITVCPGDRIILSPTIYYAYQQSGVTATYLWQPGKYVSDSTAANPLLEAVTSETFRMIGTSQFGCRDTVVFHVKVNPGAVLYLDDSAVLHPGEVYHVKSQTNCDFFRWFPTAGVSDTTSSDPTLSPSVSTRYIIRAGTEAGCEVIDSIDIRVDPRTLIDIPNAFTPGTGANSTFNVIKKGLASLTYFRIFNRWGVKVFETTDIDKGWDGNFNGQPQPFGVYVFEVEAVANTGKKVTKTGNVTLIR